MFKTAWNDKGGKWHFRISLAAIPNMIDLLKIILYVQTYTNLRGSLLKVKAGCFAPPLVRWRDLVV